MKIFIRANFDLGKDNHLWREINFYNEQKENITYQQKIYKVQDSEIGRNIYNQCTRNAGKYDIRKDKQYGHLFTE